MNIPLTRWRTYRSDTQRRRAFYKHVCKEGFFSPLRNGIREPFANPYRDGYFLSGYPSYDASRSYIRDWWLRDGDNKLEELRRIEREKDYTWFISLMMEEQRRDSELFEMLKGTGVTAFDIMAHLDWPEDKTIPRDLIEAQAFLLAIKSVLKQTKQTKNGQHHRTQKRTVQPAASTKGRKSNGPGRDRNDKCSGEGSPLRKASIGVRASA